MCANVSHFTTMITGGAVGAPGVLGGADGNSSDGSTVEEHGEDDVRLLVIICGGHFMSNVLTNCFVFLRVCLRRIMRTCLHC